MSDYMPNASAVSPSERVRFRCTGCGECCRHVHESVPLESLDLFRLALHLRNTGESITCIDDVVGKYADPVLLDECGYFVFMLKTTGSDDSCVFLKDNRCSIHAAKPRACRIYPFVAEPKEKGGFGYLVSRERAHHFTGASVKVKSWMNQYFTQEEREFLRADFDAAKSIARLLRRIPESRRSGAALHFLWYKYCAFDLEKPFLKQFHRNTQELLRVLSMMTGL